MKRNSLLRKYEDFLLNLFKGLTLTGVIMGIMAVQLLFPLTVLADRSFTMEQVEIDAQVLPDASVKVTEKITINFTGQWNGFFVSIPQGNFPIEEILVSEKGNAYEFNPGTEYGPSGTFLVKRDNENVLIDWSIDALDQRRTFYVSYRVINAVQIHDDSAELYRKFIGDANQNRVDRVKITMKLPFGAENYEQGSDIRIWGHGPLTGEVAFEGPDTVTWQLEALPPKTFLEGRVVMPPELFPEAPAEAKTGKTALPGILAEEEEWAEDANRQRALARSEMAGAFAAPLGSIAGVFLLWMKYGRRHVSHFDGQYYRELPADYSPAELSVLWNFKDIKPQDFTATILDLARRRFIKIEEDTIEVKRLIGKKDVETYRITFLETPDGAALNKPEDAALRKHEKSLLDYLKKDIAGNKPFLHLYDIEKYAKDKSKEFYGFWQQWISQLNTQTKQLGFFDKKGKMPIFAMAGGIALFILGAVAMGKMTILGLSLILSGLILAVIPALFRRRSISGQEDMSKWQAFRRFLTDFSNMEIHEIPSLVIWEHYLVYAVTLGVAKEVIKQLELAFPNLQDRGGYRFGYGWYAYGSRRGQGAFEDSFKALSKAIDSSIKTAHNAVSKASSGGGSGGGFSSGGGGGGGGSSYGGR